VTASTLAWIVALVGGAWLAGWLLGWSLATTWVRLVSRAALAKGARPARQGGVRS
jgi:hypothetical protein